ncbi:uncharacterized protein RCC_06025 [Ramularia collo-cygni]|uniref:Uncharacterized protein n=1 Tax=Ramularia collo-cygni TaxID=112498 RepID=A0A2D3UXL0_9PEZI|nr:uncharacterized protein RCC_06025 [Ramularia collo-cygni]CZT20168.1 uncharacterized protein RCC_06025 [Ramularia collo-cygni]
MSDHGRQDLSDKVAHKATPDSSKSTLDKAGETVSGIADKAGRDAVPDSHKSTGQSLGDKASRTKDEAKGEPGMMDKAKDAVGLGK